MNDHKATLEKANAAIARGDHESFLSFCTDDTLWNFIGDRMLEGKAAVRTYLADTYKQPPQVVVETLLVDGDFLVARGKITLRDAEGLETEYAYCDVWKLRDGKLAELHAFVIEP